MKTYYSIPFALLLIFGLSSCYNSRQYSSQSGWDYGDEYRMAQLQDLDDGSDVDYLVPPRNLYKNEVSREKKVSKILYSANLGLIVKDLDQTGDTLKKIAKEFNGYVSESGTYRTVIRVESQYLDQAIEAICSLGKVDRKRINGRDVTDQYLDYQIRLENAEKARVRYLELLNQAETVQAALLVEKELERLNETIDMLKGKMNRINHLDAYSTITISLKEHIKPGLLGYVGIGVYRSVKWLFVRN